MISVLLKSGAGAVVVPAQDLLGLDSRARMNIPGTMTGNWRWRLQPGQLTEEVMERLRAATQNARRNLSTTPQ
jgi:4-alpha-glucanotransferase